MDVDAVTTRDLYPVSGNGDVGKSHSAPVATTLIIIIIIICTGGVTAADAH